VLMHAAGRHAIVQTLARDSGAGHVIRPTDAVGQDADAHSSACMAPHDGSRTIDDYSGRRRLTRTRRPGPPRPGRPASMDRPSYVPPTEESDFAACALIGNESIILRTPRWT